MTSKERLLTVLQHKIPDRVPISTYDMTGWHVEPKNSVLKDEMTRYVEDNIFGTYMSGWWNREESYIPLMKYIREKADCIYMTSVNCNNAYVAKHTRYEQMQEGDSTFTKIILTTPKGDLTQTFRMDKGIYTAWEIEHRIKDESDIEKYLSIPFEPMPVDVSHLKEQEDYIGDNGILMVDISDPICEVAGMFEFGDFTVTAFTEEETITKMLDKAYEEQEYFLKDMLRQGAGPLFRMAGAEYCTPPYLPNEFFKKFVMAYDKKIIRLIHDYGRYARIHSHGKVKTVLRDLLDMEIDAIDPVEAPESGDITLKEAKEICRDKICLFGNIQLRDLELLPADQMKEVVRKCVEEGKPGGNFVALPTATPLNVPLSPRTEENFKIFIDTVLEMGVY